MARYTLERLNAKIALWEAADDAVSSGQQYSIGGRTLTRVDADFIEKKLDRLYEQLDQLQSRTGPFLVAGRVKR